jgi:hypothetical protein
VVRFEVVSASEPILSSRAAASETGSNAPARGPRRRPVAWIFSGLALCLGAWLAFSHLTYPSDKTAEGAYLRIMIAVNRNSAERAFPYIETTAQHACYTIRDYRKKAEKRVLEAYPEAERARLVERHRAVAAARDGSDVFAIYAAQHGWLNRLRRDVSGIDKVETQGDRATVQTARGTRYPFRRRENGIWGLTLFTATLVAEAEKAARDFALIDQAAADYERARATR